jgi:hypothetical protein
VLGLAAALVLVVVGVAAISAGRNGGIVGASPTPSATATTQALMVVTFEVQPKDGQEPLASALDTVFKRVRSRLFDLGFQVGMETTATGFLVWVPADHVDQAVRLIGTTGELDFVPLGQTPATAGQTIDLAAHPPLFSNDGIASAAIGANQTGQRTVDFTLTPAAAALFASYTASHIAEYFAVVLDGRVITAPTINEAIPGGQVQISQSGIGGYPLADAQDLVAIIGSGALPYPVREVERRVLGPNDTPLPPAPTTPPAATPSTSPSTPSASPSTPIASSSPAAVTGSWTGLVVEPAPGAPASIEHIIPWSGGYLAVATTDSNGSEGGWTSPDGRTWTAIRSTTLDLNGPDGGAYLGGTACGDGLLVLTRVGSTATAWSSSDGVGWTSAPLAGIGSAELAGGPAGAVMPVEDSPAVTVTTDCATWTTIDLPGPAKASVSRVTAFAGGFVAVGFAGTTGTPSVSPLAWWSTDGTSWFAATVAARKGDGFETVAAGGAGLVATSTQPGYTPGTSTLWTSADGKTWAPVKSGPLGVVASGEGMGSVLGWFSGDGTRLLVAGTPQAGGAVEYRVSSDGSAWQTLAVTGSGKAAITGDRAGTAFLLRDGILVSDGTSAWVGTATTP